MSEIYHTLPSNIEKDEPDKGYTKLFENRNQKRKEQYRRVYKLGLCSIVIGIVIHFVTISISEEKVDLIGTLFIVAGIISLCAVPVSNLNCDEFLCKQYWLRVTLLTTTLGLLLPLGVSILALPPYLPGALFLFITILIIDNYRNIDLAIDTQSPGLFLITLQKIIESSSKSARVYTCESSDLQRGIGRHLIPIFDTVAGKFTGAIILWLLQYSFTYFWVAIDEEDFNRRILYGEGWIPLWFMYSHIYKSSTRFVSAIIFILGVIFIVYRFVKQRRELLKYLEINIVHDDKLDDKNIIDAYISDDNFLSNSFQQKVAHRKSMHQLREYIEVMHKSHYQATYDGDKRSRSSNNIPIDEELNIMKDIYSKFYMWERQNEVFCTASLNLYDTMLTTLTLNGLIVSVEVYAVYSNTEKDIEANFYFLHIIASLFPLFIVAFVGRNYWFCILNAFVEGDMESFIKEGLWMAHLATNADIVDTVTNSLWIYRSTPNPLLSNCENPRYISRYFFARATVIECNQNYVLGEIRMKEDLDITWEAYYEKDKLLIERVDRTAAEVAENHPVISFHEWIDSIAKNNHTIQVIHVDEESQLIRLKYLVETTVEAEKLLEYSLNNLRKYTLKSNFESDLIVISPRELKTDGDKQKMLEKSVSVDTKQILKHKSLFQTLGIDYFISHAWADAGETKVKMLQKFAKDFKYKKSFTSKYPTVWLDKVCIDQKNPSLGISVLPINIAFCKKMVILLSKNYLKRLWCVWELFTLFSFVSKEIALSRIDIVPIDNDHNSYLESLKEMKKILRSFSLNDAHCFSPNEEYKLRQIIYTIGEHRIVAIKESILLVVSMKIAEMEKYKRIYTTFTSLLNQTKEYFGINAKEIFVPEVNEESPRKILERTIELEVNSQ